MKSNYIHSIYSVLLSLLLCAALPEILFPQEPLDTIVTDNVFVTAKKIAELTMESSKNIILISKEDIQNAPAENLQELLSYYAGVDVKKRGPSGVQADLSIRGGSFEQVLLLVDGLRLNDPQTGHNNLNIPVNLEDIERIEILKGQASGIYGANALSGAINIITKKKKNNELQLNGSVGENGFYKGGLSFSHTLGELANTVSFSKEKSDGYRFNTGSDILTAAYNSSLQFTSGSGKFSVGFTDKKFGANGFYSDRYPNQWEHLSTALSSFVLNFILKDISVSPKLYWRNNRDNYLLDKNRPSFYNNLHKTNSYGAEIQSSWSNEFVRFIFGCETGYDDITSTNLGDHNRKKGGLSLSAVLNPLEKLKFVFGGFLYKYDNFGWKYWPGMDMAFELNENLSLKASIGKSFRIPTFTELYYNSPAQVGNYRLQPEEALSYETGLYYSSSSTAASLCLFSRKGNNLIDWVRYSSDKPWQAENITKINTVGIDVNYSLKPVTYAEKLLFKKISFGYSYLTSDLKLGSYESKYILDHLRHQFIAEFMHPLPYDLVMNWIFRYEDRLNQKKYFITDCRLSLGLHDYEFYLEASNLFNKSYMDFSGIPMPGRWIIGGVGTSFDLD